MKILQVCNDVQSQSGKDWVAEADKRLLKKNGHRIMCVGQDNKKAGNINRYHLSQSTHLQGMGNWRDQSSSTPIIQIIQKHRPNVVHVYNIITSMNSPHLYSTCQKLGISVIQSLYRYEALCPKSNIFYSNKLCISCMKQSLLKGDMQQKCCRDNQTPSMDVVRMIRDHWSQKAYHENIDCYLVPTEFFKEKLIEYGFPNHKVAVKPLLSDDIALESREVEDYALFIGKLTEESGIRTLLNAWSSLPDFPLKILGDGPLKQEVLDACSSNTLLSFLGWQSKEDCTFHLSRALLLVFPKESYETFPSTVVRSYAHGVPVIASDLGGMGHFVIDGVVGCLFPPGDAQVLAEKVSWLWKNRDILTLMREKARAEYEGKYTIERNYQILINLYQDTLSQKKSIKPRYTTNRNPHYHLHNRGFLQDS
jgi:glycosyltransferase involved in cell wall biosynthesis